MFNYYIIFGLMLQIVGYKSEPIVNKYFLEKQKFLYKILHRIEDAPLTPLWQDMGLTLITDKTQYLEYNDKMLEFQINYQNGKLLPRRAYYSPLLEMHANQTIGLFLHFYNALDWWTLQKNVEWARLHCNAAMFLQALTQTVMKRQSFRPLMLPKIYELLPQHFYHQQFVLQMERFNYWMWIRWQQHKVNENYTENQTNLRNERKNWQWWRSEGFAKEVYSVSHKYLLPRLIGDLRGTHTWMRAMEDVTILWMPVDYSRDVMPEHDHAVRKITYLTEDIGWNAYWYYLNMALTRMGVRDEEAYDWSKIREWWFWNLQQIVVRYKLEAYALGIDLNKSNKSKSKNNITKHLKEFNYEPALITLNAENFRSPSPYEVHIIEEGLKDLITIVQTAIAENGYQLRNGSKLNLEKGQHFDYFLDNLYGSDITKFYSKYILAAKYHYAADVKPKLLYNWETMLRDPMFYANAVVLLNSYGSLRGHFQKYNLTAALAAPGCKVNNVNISPLITYDEIVDADVSSLLHNKHYYFEGQFAWFKTMQARQQRLQHKPFKIEFNITANQPKAVVVRTFLSANINGSEILYQFDIFVTNLSVGHNIVQRQSRQFFGTITDHISHTELYHYARLGYYADDSNTYDFPLNATTPACGFPNRLLLPKGHENGLSMIMYFILTPYVDRQPKGRNYQCNFSEGILAYDEKPYGFPFEWNNGGIQEDGALKKNIKMLENVYKQQVKIYHKKVNWKNFLI